MIIIEYMVTSQKELPQEKELTAKRAEEITPGEAFRRFKDRLVDAVNEELPDEEKISDYGRDVSLDTERGEMVLRQVIGFEEKLVDPEKKTLKDVPIYKLYKIPAEITRDVFATLKPSEQESFIEGFETAMATSKQIIDRARAGLKRELRADERERLEKMITDEEAALAEHEKLIEKLQEVSA